MHCIYSIKNLIDHPNANPKAVQAVILMTDGEFNYYGDPLGRGTGIPVHHRTPMRIGMMVHCIHRIMLDSTHIDKYTILPGLPNQNMAALASAIISGFTPSPSHRQRIPTTDTWKTMDTLSTDYQR